MTYIELEMEKKRLKAVITSFTGTLKPVSKRLPCNLHESGHRKAAQLPRDNSNCATSGSRLSFTALLIISADDRLSCTQTEIKTRHDRCSLGINKNTAKGCNPVCPNWREIKNVVIYTQRERVAS